MRAKLIALATLVALNLTLSNYSDAAEKTKNDYVVKDGMTVSFDYTLKDTDGKILETTKGKTPLRYTHGQKQMIPGLEKQLAGMKVGEEKNVRVKPDEAYGPVNKDAFHEVPKEKIPPDGLKVGAMLATKGPDGQVIPVRVAEIKDKTVVMDFNHPMAGKTLVFDVKIVDIQPASAATQPPKPSAPNAPAKSETPAKPAEPAKK
jgi:FKBP-type peptidyl-prolyl cis-trans isomerase 2